MTVESLPSEIEPGLVAWALANATNLDVRQLGLPRFGTTHGTDVHIAFSLCGTASESLERTWERTSGLGLELDVSSSVACRVSQQLSPPPPPRPPPQQQGAQGAQGAQGQQQQQQQQQQGRRLHPQRRLLEGAPPGMPTLNPPCDRPPPPHTRARLACTSSALVHARRRNRVAG
jgi:hypothetical protein